MQQSDRLKGRIQEIAKRIDVDVLTKTIGKKAGKRAIAQARQHLPSDLVDVFEVMNGCHFRWDAIAEAGLRGEIRLPQVSQRYSPSGGDIDFGDEKLEWLILDADSHVYLLREVGAAPDDALVVYAAPADEADYSIVAASVAEYLERSIEVGFAHFHWMDDSVANDNATFLASPATRPPDVRAGVRVAINRGRRGIVEDIVELETAPKNFLYSEYLKWARVRTDDNRMFWVPTNHARPVSVKDAYERVLASPDEAYTEILAADPDAALAAMLPFVIVDGAIKYAVQDGNVEHVSLNDGAIILANTLRPLKVSRAVEILAGLIDHTASLDNADETRSAKWKKKDAYDPDDYRHANTWTPSQVMEVLGDALICMSFRAQQGLETLTSDHPKVLPALREAYCPYSFADNIKPLLGDVKGEIERSHMYPEWVENAESMKLEPPGDGTMVV